MMTPRPLCPLLLLAALLPAGCGLTPSGVAPERGFDLERYLGKWYEIARLDHWFERGLTDVSAEYSRRPDGGIAVLNRGFDPRTGAWREARGRGYRAGAPDEARLKVTFFWPFYGGCNVLALDRENYAWALVCGPNRDYLWILARARALEPALVERLVALAGKLGFPVGKLYFVPQEREDA